MITFDPVVLVEQLRTVRLCKDCGRIRCAKRAFLDTKPEWVGDNPSYYNELVVECTEAAQSLGQRYANLFAAATAVANAGVYCMGEPRALETLLTVLQDIL